MPSPPRVGLKAQCALPTDLQPAPSEDTSSSSDGDADVTPPEVLNQATAKLLDAMGLMIRSRWGTARRHHPNLLLPVEILDGADLRWTLRAADSPHRHPTRLTLEHLAQRTHHAATTDEAVCLIDSPRSVIVLARNGYSPAALRAVKGDVTTTARRQRSAANLLPEYHTFCREVSSAFIAAVLRGDIDPMTHVVQARTESGRTSTVVTPKASPRKHSPRLPLVAPPTALEAQAMTPSRCRPQDLKRLQLHRAAFTVDWGAKQQALANETFNVQRVKQNVTQRIEDIRRKAASSLGITATDGQHGERHNSHERVHSPALDATQTSQPAGFLTPEIPPAKPSLAATYPLISQTPEPRASSRLSQTSADQGPILPHTMDVRTNTASTLKRCGTSPASSRVEQVRHESKRIEEVRRQQVEAGIERKAQRAAVAAERRREAQLKSQHSQHAKAREAHDVVDRMNVAAEVRRMQVVRQLEQDTEARMRWREEQYAKGQALRKNAKIRTTLQHQTRAFVEKATIAIAKATGLQETAVDRSVVVQRNLKTESRTKLLRLLQEEDKMLRVWDRFEAKPAVS
jgi:hypothetical protein